MIIWRTFQNKTIPATELDQQHLSNIYWYHKIFFNYNYEFVFDELKNRFNGQILPYKPHISFKLEMNGLKERNMLVETNADDHLRLVKKYSIILNDQVIGEYQIPLGEYL